MKKFEKGRNIFVILSGLVFCVLFALIFIFNPSYTKAATVSMEGNAGVKMYVNGEYVTCNDGANNNVFYVTEDCRVTIYIINDNKIAVSETGKSLLTIKENGVNLVTSDQQIASFDAEVGKNYTVTVNSRAIRKEDNGKSLSAPFIISSHLELETLDAILRDETLTNEEKVIHSEIFANQTKDELRTSYFRLADNIIYVGEEYYGLKDFSGVFDFNNKIVTLNIENTSPTFTTTTNVGLFANLLSDTVDGKQYPCVIRNGIVRGSTSIVAPTAGSASNTLNYGGIAGHATRNVVVDNVVSSMSVTAETNTNINIGGVFGYNLQPLNDHNELGYEGIYTTVKAVTNGQNCNVNAGIVFGVLRNTYINSIELHLMDVSVIAVSSNEKSGNVNAGGLIGLVECDLGNSDPYTHLNIKNLLIDVTEAVSVTAEINNSNNNNTEREAVAGGVIGRVTANDPVYFYQLNVEEEDPTKESLLEVYAITQSETSTGDAYAGGLIGYLPGSNCYFGMEGDTSFTFFDCSVNVEAIQNGYSEAYAGAMFGYRSLIKDNNYNLNIKLNNEDETLTVLAQQTALSRNPATGNRDSDLRMVAAGYVTSYLQNNFNFNNFELTVNNGKVTAERAVGSRIYGPLYAGGFAGYARADNSNDNTFTNIKMNYNNSAVYGLSSSFDSNKNNTNMYYTGTNSNTCVGGFIGFMQNYGVASNGTGSTIQFGAGNKPGIDNLTIKFNNTTTSDGVIGIHNAYSNSANDYVVQGYVGGVVGLSDQSYFRNLNVIGLDATNKTKISLDALSNPNTANCGGLVGTNVRERNFLLSQGRVDNMHVILTAYTNQEDDQYFDAFCGGAIGSLSNIGANRNTEINDVVVQNSIVDCVGENLMYTFAGGIAGGMWWSNPQRIISCSFINGDVNAYSMSGISFAGGIAGQGGPNATIDSCKVVNSTVYCFNGSNKESGAAGISGYTRNSSGSVTYANNYSNAYVYADGSNSSVGGLYANGGTGNNTTSNIFDPFNVEGMSNNANYTIGDRAKSTVVALNRTGSGQNNYRYFNQHTITDGTTFTVYPQYTLSNSSVLKIEYSGDTSVIDTEETENNTFKAKNNVVGIVYANLYITIDNHDGDSSNDKYLFMSYPIFIDRGDNKLSFSFNNDIENGPDYKWYSSSYGIIHYRQVNVTSNPQPINVSLSDNKVFPDYKLYSPTNGTTGVELVTNKGDQVYINSFNNKIDIDVSDRLLVLTPNTDLAVRTVFIMELPYWYGGSTGYSYLVLDYIPNYVVSLDTQISEETPYLGVDSGSYVFSRGDTINLDTLEIYADSTSSFSNYITYARTGTNVTGITLNPNGTINIGNNATYNSVYTITATYGGNRYNGEGTLTDTISIVIKESYTLTTELYGANFESNRKVVNGIPFEFSISPNAGYGLDPDRIIITIGAKTYTIQNLLVNPKNEALNNAVNTNKAGTLTIDGGKFSYEYDSLTDTYTFVIDGEIVKGNINVLIEYSLISSIVIDRGLIYEIAGHERYFIYQLKDGTKLTNEIFAPIKDEINLEIYGYDFQKYYLTDNGTSVESYGMHLSDLIDQGYEMHGPLYLYARWTYQVILEYPDNVTVESTLPLTMLEKVDQDGVIHLIPINTTTPFTFKITPNEFFEGDPTFVVYTISREEKPNGEYEYTSKEITQYCIKNMSGAYEVDPYVINGVIYIKVFNESIVFNDGEKEIDQSLDTDISTDSTFTINYSINYNKEGVSLDKTIAGNKNVEVTFTKNQFPAGTIIRLYRHINNKPYDSYYYVLTSSSQNLYLDYFINMDTGLTLADSVVNISSVTSEKYYLVITLPNNTSTYSVLSNNIIEVKIPIENESHNYTYYGIASDELPPLPSGFKAIESYNTLPTMPLSVTQNGNSLVVDLGGEYYVEVEQSNNLSFEGKTYYWKVESNNALSDANLTILEEYFGSYTYLAADKKTAYYGASTTTFDGDLPSGITLSLIQVEDDLRHQNKTYVWEITANKELTSSTVNTANSIFGANNQIAQTLNSVYYLAESTTYNNLNNLSGYTIRLLEVENTHSPASGIVVYSITF